MPTREELLALQEIINESGFAAPQRQAIIDKYQPTTTSKVLAGIGDAISQGYGGRSDFLEGIYSRAQNREQNDLDSFDANKKIVVENYINQKKLDAMKAQDLLDRERTLADKKEARSIALSDLKDERAYKSREEAEKRAHDLEIEKLKIDAQGKKGQKQFENLRKDEQNTIDKLSNKNAEKLSIANQIDSVLANWDKLPDDQKVAQGRQLLKTLNSTEGADAIGSEEAKRLGQKLEFVLVPRPSNNFQAGRDLEGFFKQASDTSKSVRRAIESNTNEINKIYNGAINTGSTQQEVPTTSGLTPEQRRQRIRELQSKIRGQ